ncbi:MAG: AbrB/MazE/SpoVT family DNA-binding domain-containing protein [Bacteroidales bacterium]|jgi:antitoxin MazE|nr:AbrB/MazE/SpoVT family DNA-binding domain-containing protein [Bacteroidales bacterium]
MDVAVIKIGNSKGIRLSKTILEKYDIKDVLEVILEKDHIVLKPKAKPRKGWDKAFKKMHDNGDDKLIVPDVFHDEDHEEWK